MPARISPTASTLSALAGALLGMGNPASSSAQGSGKMQVVDFDHKACASDMGTCRASYVLKLQNDRKFEIKIRNTDKTNFVYDVAGVLAARPSTAAAQGESALGDTAFVQTHDKKYGGYLVNIRLKPNAKSRLPEATLMISVQTDEWTLGFAGGFPVSTLTDKRFALRDTTINDAKQSIVTREKKNEDDLNLATATFIHVSHTSRPGLGLSFGVGIGGSASYYAGVSKLFGNVGALTVGPVFGTRKDLPTGVRVKDLTTNANLLANLSERTRMGIFAGFSFTFLGNDRGPFEKPFKGSQSSGNGSAGAGDGAAPRGEATNPELSLNITPDVVQAGTTITLRLELTGDAARLNGMKVTVSDVIGPIDLPKNGSIELKTKEDGTGAFATMTAKITQLQGSEETITVTLKITGAGLTAQPVTSNDLTVKAG